jgi:Tfp pilus assembly protein PilF
VAIRLSNLGGVLRAQGDFAGARALYERALRIDEAAYGPNHPAVARDANNLGLVLKEQGDLAGARVLYERALRVICAALGDEHPSAQTVSENLEILLQQMPPGSDARSP